MVSRRCMVVTRRLEVSSSVVESIICHCHWKFDPVSWLETSRTNRPVRWRHFKISARESLLISCYECFLLSTVFALQAAWSWRNLRIADLHDLYCLPNVIMKMRRVGGGGGQKCIHSFGGETWRKEALGRARHRWEDNIKMDIKEVEWEGVDWICWVTDKWQDAVDTVLNTDDVS